MRKENKKKKRNTQDCETCKNYYTCDNMGYYEECLPDYLYYEEKDADENKK